MVNNMSWNHMVNNMSWNHMVNNMSWNHMFQYHVMEAHVPEQHVMQPHVSTSWHDESTCMFPQNVSKPHVFFNHMSCHEKLRSRRKEELRPWPRFSCLHAALLWVLQIEGNSKRNKAGETVLRSSEKVSRHVFFCCAFSWPSAWSGQSSFRPSTDSPQLDSSG